MAVYEVMLVGWEEIHYTFDRGRRIDRMDRGKDQDSRLRGGQGGVAGFAIPDISYVEDVGGMHCRFSKRLLVCLDVAIHFPLVYYGFFIFKREFDRIFDRHYVPSEILVYIFDHRGHRSRLAASRQAGQEDKAAPFVA